MFKSFQSVMNLFISKICGNKKTKLQKKKLFTFILLKKKKNLRFKIFSAKHKAIITSIKFFN